MLDRVELILNQDILTRESLDRRLMALQKKGRIPPESDRRAAENEILTGSAKHLLAVQAGQDMGLDPAQVRRQVRQYLERETERHEGVVGFVNYLQSREVDAAEHRREIEETMYAQAWEDYVTGEGPAPQAARVSVDRYVRPGLLLFEYENVLAQPEALPLIGGRRQSVTLQFLVVDPSATGGDSSAAQQLGIQLRERILAGEDMAELNQRYGAAKRAFQTEPIDEAQLKAAQPALGAFIGSAQPGDVSEVLAYTFRGQQQWRIVRLVSREPPEIPKFQTLAVQRRIAEQVERNLADYRHEAALEDLLRDSYVWPPEVRSKPARRPTK